MLDKQCHPYIHSTTEVCDDNKYVPQQLSINDELKFMQKRLHMASSDIQFKNQFDGERPM